MNASEPVVVFRSNDPDECGAVAGALLDQNVQAWVHDDAASPLGSPATIGAGLFPRPACVSVRVLERERALALIATMIPGARAQKRDALDPIHGQGRTISPGWRALALLALTGFVVFGVVRLIQVFEGLRR